MTSKAGTKYREFFTQTGVAGDYQWIVESTCDVCVRMFKGEFRYTRVAPLYHYISKINRSTKLAYSINLDPRGSMRHYDDA